jgi:hypothetical protein
MKTKHTPGPWKFHKGRGIDPRFHVQTVGGYQISETPKNGIACGIESANEANARLIAAAPDLLNALELALATIQRLAPPKPYDHTQGTRDVINAAIAKATGGAA